MSAAQVSCRDYYRRWLKEFLRDLFRLGRGHAVSLLLAAGVLALQLRLHVVQSAVESRAWASVLWPYAALALVLVLVSVVRAPVKVDRARDSDAASLAAQLEKQEGHVVELTEQARRLGVELEEARKPAVDHAEAQIRAEVAKILASLGDLDKRILREAVIRGEIIAGDHAGDVAKKLGLGVGVFLDALTRLAATPLLEYHYESERKSRAIWWDIPKGYTPSLRALLFQG